MVWDHLFHCILPLVAACTSSDYFQTPPLWHIVTTWALSLKRSLSLARPSSWSPILVVESMRISLVLIFFFSARRHGSLHLVREKRSWWGISISHVFFMQAVFGVDSIYKYRNCLECFYQTVPSKNGLLLSLPQHFQIPQGSVYILSSGKSAKE